MKNLRPTYCLTCFLLVLFAAAFFLAPSFMPIVRSWKAEQLLASTSIYKSREDLANTEGLLDAPTRRAKTAMLLVPDEVKFARNYVELRALADPFQAIPEWEKMLAHPQATRGDREKLVHHALEQIRLKSSPMPFERRRALALPVAKRQMERLASQADWLSNPAGRLLQAEVIAESGQAKEALVILDDILEETEGKYPDAVFLYAKLATHLNDSARLRNAAQLLVPLSLQTNEIGIRAIRHMTFVDHADTISLRMNAWDRCLRLLKTNKHSQDIDFLRIHALRFRLAEQDDLKSRILQEAADLFELDDNKQLFIYCNWLGTLRAFPRLLQELSPQKARMEESLFKLRMNALAATSRIDEMQAELTNAPVISSALRLKVSARLNGLAGEYEQAATDLDQLIETLGKDTRLLGEACHYFEASGDIRALCHLLERLLDEPGMKTYANRKLLAHRAVSARISDLKTWIGNLRESHPDDPALHVTDLYYKLLDPNLPKVDLPELTAQARQLLERHDEREFRVTLALAHLRNDEPDKALPALGDLSNWRAWADTRHAWLFICSHILRKNKDTQTALRLEAKFDPERLTRAEKDSLSALFPKSFPQAKP